MSEILQDKCVICRVTIDVANRQSWSQVKQAGLNSLILYSDLRKDSCLNEYLKSNPEKVLVHDACRKQYTCKRRFEQSQRAAADCIDFNGSTPAKALRSSVSDPFSWKDHCMLCGEHAVNDNKHPDRSSISAVRTLEIRETLKACCTKRNDAWSVEVEGRLNSCNDLVAPEAVYHRNCFAAFSQMQSRPNHCKTCQNRTRKGRPTSTQKMSTFEMLCSWIEVCDNELYSLDDLVVMMSEFAGKDEDCVYSKQQLKAKLEEKYGRHSFFCRNCW